MQRSIVITPSDIQYKNTSIADKLEGTTNVYLHVPRNSDTVIIDGLIIQCCDIDHVTSFEILIGGSNIWNIPFKLLMKISTITECDGKYFIKFNDSLFSNYKMEIMLGALKYHQVDVILDANKQINYTLLVSWKYYDDEMRKKYEFNPFEFKITNYESIDVDMNVNNRIDPHFVSTGIFVESMAPILNFELKLSGCEFINYDVDMIKFYKCLISKRMVWSKKHHLTLKFILGKFIPLDVINLIEMLCEEYEFTYWFPFVADNTYLITNDDATVNFSKINDIHVFIKSNCDKGKLYIQRKNIQRYMSGMSCLAFSN